MPLDHLTVPLLRLGGEWGGAPKCRRVAAVGYGCGAIPCCRSVRAYGNSSAPVWVIICYHSPPHGMRTVTAALLHLGQAPGTVTSACGT